MELIEGELEADQVYILMSDEYRISRNVRAQWYFSHLNRLIQVPRRHLLSQYQGELVVVSVVPVDPPPDWDSDTSHLYRYRVTTRTSVTFLARAYRLVFCLDLSPSVARVDTWTGTVLLDCVFPTLKRCLQGITRPFYVPGSELLYKPQIYVTVIAHTPFFTTQTHQVLVQGWRLTEDNLRSFLDTVGEKLNVIEDRFADVTALANDQLEAQRLESERLVGKLFDLDGGDGGGPSAVPMVSPDMGFVNTLRYGILALQLLPENSSAGLVVVTDGSIGLPDATMFDSLLVQLRNNTVACSFLLLGAGCQPSAGLGALPYTDLMHFLATATCGALLSHLPAVSRDYDYTMNAYHRAFLSWGFQKSLVGLSLMPDRRGGPSEPPDPWPPALLRSCVPETPVELILKHQKDGELSCSLASVLSCRLREAYNIRSVELTDDSIQISLVLPWKYSIFIEYQLRAAWPPTSTASSVRYTINVIADYDFLHDVTCAHSQPKSLYRKAMLGRHWTSLKSLRHSDTLLEHLHSFNSSATYHTVPEVVKSGSPLFYLSESTGAPEPFSGEPAYQAFCTFWKPVCMLDINIWQKWMHAHRIGLLLEHDHPLPKHLYQPNNSGRYTSVQCRQATKAVISLLAEVSDFALLDGHSYIKFLYSDEEPAPGTPPTSFYMLRVNLAIRPPCMVVRLAFLGGTPGHLRNQIVRELREKILSLTFTEGQSTLSADPPIRKRARLIERPAPPKPAPPEDSHGERVLTTPEVSFGGGRAATQEVHCCILLRKPAEKFLIRYERVPVNFLSPVIQEAAPGGRASALTRHLRSPAAYGGLSVSTQNRTASTMFNTLSRYLHHRRWVWDMQEGRGPSMSMAAMARIMSTIVKSRLQEGFSFAHSSLGVLNLVLELELQHPPLRDGHPTQPAHAVPLLGGAPPADHLHQHAQQTLPFVVQYVLFPPHLTAPAGSRDNLSVSEEEPAEGEMEVPESDSQAQIVTECWLEPQSGRLSTQHQRHAHFNQLTYDQLANKFYELDRECISVLVTMEYLSMLCERGTVDSVPSPSQSDASSPSGEELCIQRVPFCFDLPRLLRRCQQAEILLSTFIQDVADLDAGVVGGGGGGGGVGGSRFSRHEPDACNRELYRLLLETVEQLHQRQLQLSERDCRQLPGLITERQRPQHRPFPPFNADMSGRVPRWRCYVKAISPTHVVVTLLPASFDDLKQLVWGGPHSWQLPADQAAAADGGGRADSLHTDSVGSSLAGAPVRSMSLCTRSAASQAGRRVGAGAAPAPALRSRACSAGACSSAASAAKKSVTLVTGDAVTSAASPGEGLRDRPTRPRSRHPSSPSKLQQPELAEPGRCPHRSRSFPNSEAATVYAGKQQQQQPAQGSTGQQQQQQQQRRRAWSRPGRRRPARLGTLPLPVYVFDCALRTLTTQLGYRGSGQPPPDVCRDARFTLLLETTRSEAEAAASTGQPAATAHAPDRSGAHTQHDEPPEEPAHLVEHCDVLQLAHTRAFVVGVFRALQAELTVHPQDVQAAIDLCDEQPLEVDVTDFLKTICGHIRDLTQRGGEQRPGAGERRLPLSLLHSHQPCQSLQQTHAHVRRLFGRILRASFGTAPASPDVYFYLPPERRSLLDDDADRMTPDDYPERVPSAEDEDTTVQLNDIDGAAAAGWGDRDHPEDELFSVVTKTSLMSNVDSESVCDLEERAGDVAEGDANETEENTPPLFLQLTCTTRTGCNTYTRHIRDLPTCLGELTDDMVESDLSMDTIQVTLDILCLTLPIQVEARIAEHTKHQVRATSFCSDGLASSDLPDISSCSSNSSIDSFSGGQLGTQLGHLSEYQLQAVTSTKSEVHWLLADEIAALLLDAQPVTWSVLTKVADHVGRSAAQLQSSRPRRGCVYKHIPLHFVYGPQKGMDKFMKEFQQLTVPGYKLAQLDSLYYLVHESSVFEPRGYNRLAPIIQFSGCYRASLTPPPPDVPAFTADQTTSLQRPCTPDAVMRQTQLARSFSVDLCQYASSMGSISDDEFGCPCGADLDSWATGGSGGAAASGGGRRRLRRSVSHRPCSTETQLTREDREVAALFSAVAATLTRRRPRSQGLKSLPATSRETRRCRSAAEVRLLPTSPSPDSGEAGTVAAARDHRQTSPARVVSAFSAVENVHLTEEGYEGDGDNNSEETDADAVENERENAERIQLPAFWLILRVSDDAVDTFFHCRYRRESICDNMAIHDQVIAKIHQICKRVNQMLLLQELEVSRVCDNLLEPESSADIWGTDEHVAAPYSQPPGLSPDEHSGHYLEANMKFQPGYFACPLMWRAAFALHPRLRGSAHAATPGLAYLRQALETFAVTNRRSMFVFKDPKQEQDVFYLRLCERLPGSAHPSGDSHCGAACAGGGEERLPPAAGRGSVTSLRDEERTRASSSVAERDRDGCSSRHESGDGIQLLVHGITEPGSSIKQDLVQMLHKRLDERLLELFSKALLRNPQTKLAPEDVHFLQPPGAPPDRSLKYTLPPSATPHLNSVVSYLRHNLLQLLHQPKYTDSRPENHFRDWGSGDDADMFLYVPPEKHGGRGMACISLSAVRPSPPDQPPSVERPAPAAETGAAGRSAAAAAAAAQLVAPLVAGTAAAELVAPLVPAATPVAPEAAGGEWTPERFETLTSTGLYDPDVDGHVEVLLQFNIWEKGRANLGWLESRLPSAIRYALWDLCTICHLLPHRPLECSIARHLSSALRAGKLPDEGTASTMARFLDRRISSPLTQLQERLRHLSSSAPQDAPAAHQHPDTAPSSGQSTPRFTAADGVPAAAGTPLRHIYGDHLHRWLLFGSGLSVPNLKRLSIQLSNRYPVEAFLSGVMRLVHDECATLTCHLCWSEPGTGRYELCDPAALQGADDAEHRLLLLVARGNRDDYGVAAASAQRLSCGGQLQTPVAAAAGGEGGTSCSSVPPSPGPTTAHMTFRTPALGDRESAGAGCSTPVTPATPFSGAPPAARQKLVWARIEHKQMELFTYNWPKEKWDHLQKRCIDLANWTNARCSLLHSVVAQKLGLFHHQPYTRRYATTSGKASNPYLGLMAYVTPLIHHTRPPPPSAQLHRAAAARPGRMRVFTETLRDCKPAQLAPPAQGQPADAVLKHGQQLIDVYRANRKGEEQKKLYHQCQTPESLNKDATMESFVRLLRTSGRLLHFCYSPLLFLPGWRWQTAVTRDQALLSARELAAAGSAARAAAGSGGARRSRRRQPSESSMRSGGRPSPRLRRQAADERWHEALCSSLLGEYMQYLQTLGFLPLRPGLQPGRGAVDGGSGAGAAEASAMVVYLHRVVAGGGYMLFEVGIEEPFFYVKLYALEGLRVRTRNRATPINAQAFQSFLSECDEIRCHTHVHSYLHDYHLRVMQQYVSGRPLLLRQGLHVVSLLEDFYNYYPKGPSHARNFMATGSVTFEEQTSTSPDQLYNYLLAHEKRYRMRVLRMMPLFEDCGDDTSEDEYVLVQLSWQQVRRAAGGGADAPAAAVGAAPSEGLIYDLALVVSRDLADPAADARLKLKFYVLMTSRREIYPTMFIERRFENYRRVDTAPGVLSESPAANFQGGRTGRRKRRSEAGGAGTGGDDGAVASTSCPGNNGALNTYSTLRPESVHYLGYFSSHEQFMQRVLGDAVDKFRRHVLEVVRRATVHCRRDSLWQRLRDDEERSRGGSGSGSLSCAEMAELLSLVCCTPLQEMDQRLTPLTRQPTGWYHGLVRTLQHKYPDCHRYYASDSGQQRFLVVLLPAELNSMLVLSVDADTPLQPARLYLVSRESASDQQELPASPAAPDAAEQLLHRQLEQFVDCCCYQMWAALIA